MIPRDSQERQLLIAEHVLGLLSPEQAAEVERWLEQDDDAAQLASHWQQCPSWAPSSSKDLLRLRSQTRSRHPGILASRVSTGVH